MTRERPWPPRQRRKHWGRKKREDGVQWSRKQEYETGRAKSGLTSGRGETRAPWRRSLRGRKKKRALREGERRYEHKKPTQKPKEGGRAHT